VEILTDIFDRANGLNSLTHTNTISNYESNPALPSISSTKSSFLATPNLDIDSLQYLNSDIIPAAQLALQQFVATPEFTVNIQQAFGYGCNLDLAHTLIDHFSNGQDLPAIAVLSQSQLRANGAFGNDTVFLSQDLLNSDHKAIAISVLLEELGHYIDSQINSSDASGDEGAIFAKLVQNQPFQVGEMAALKQEDDHGLLTLQNANGQSQTIAVEHSDLLGVFVVGATGKISIDFLADAGSYHSEMAVFSLKGMESLTEGSAAYIKEAARRALTSSILGYVAIRDSSEGAKFTGELGEANKNDAGYFGAKAFNFDVGDRIAFMLVPQGTVQEVFNNPSSQGNKRPLFSLSSANPSKATQLGQLVSGTFGWEDLRVDQGSDADYNDIVFQVKGVTGSATDLSSLIASRRDWRGLSTAQELIAFANNNANLTAGLAQDTGVSDTDKITNNPTIQGTLTGTAGFTKFQAKLNLGNFVDVLAKLNADGTFTLDMPTLTQINGGQLPDGVYQLSLKAEDKFGNVSNEVKLDFTFDTSAPQAPGTMLDSLFDAAPLGDSQTTFAKVNLLGQTEANATVTLDGTNISIVSDAIGKFKLADVAMALGDNLFTVRAKDIAGNSSAFTFLLKRVAQTNSDVVLDWNATLLNVIMTDKTPPPVASRNMAMVQAAVFDAINSFDLKYKNYNFAGTAPIGASPDAAAASAAYTVLLSLYPNQKVFFDTALAASLAKIADGVPKTDGIAFGKLVGNDILTLRSNDGSNTVVSYTPGTNVGDWQPTPPAYAAAALPQWGKVTPFGLTIGSQFRPAGPPALMSAEYATDFNQVKDLGSLTSTTRTADQTQIANFWADGSGTYTPPGHWNQIAQNVVATMGRSLVDNARLFALLDIALADAGIAAWDAKYTYNFWRPITAIQNADKDGNVNTVVDPNWKPLLTTPNFSEYVSGHSTFSGAADTILTTLLGNNLGFTTNSLGTSGVNRTFTNFDAAANEAGISRIYGGIHFNSANVDGLATGKSIGDYILTNLLT
jgi:hypothetical protein